VLCASGPWPDRGWRLRPPLVSVDAATVSDAESAMTRAELGDGARRWVPKTGGKSRRLPALSAIKINYWRLVTRLFRAVLMILL
jgi:hypothetical protein